MVHRLLVRKGQILGGIIMITLILTLLVVLVLAVYVRYETVSPKLVVKEAATYTGAVVGATPEVVRTTVKVAKAANAVSELALKEAGEQGPVGFREGKVVAAKATRDFFSSVNSYADKELKEATEALKAREEGEEA